MHLWNWVSAGYKFLKCTENNFVLSTAIWYFMRFRNYKQLTRTPDELRKNFIDV
jgi:hypothetical protein